MRTLVNLRRNVDSPNRTSGARPVIHLYEWCFHWAPSGATRPARRTACENCSRVVLCHVIQEQAGTVSVPCVGLKKVQMEMLWTCFTYNLQYWIRLRDWR